MRLAEVIDQGLHCIFDIFGYLVALRAGITSLGEVFERLEDLPDNSGYVECHQRDEDVNEDVAEGEASLRADALGAKADHKETEDVDCHLVHDVQDVN